MPAHSQGTFCRVLHFGINTAAPAVGLSKNDKNYVTYGMVFSWLQEPDKTKINATTRTHTCTYSSKNIS